MGVFFDRFKTLDHSNFEFVSDFEFRASSFHIFLTSNRQNLYGVFTRREGPTDINRVIIRYSPAAEYAAARCPASPRHASAYPQAIGGSRIRFWPRFRLF